MLGVLDARFERLEKEKTALFRRLDGLSDETLNRSPGEGRWSVIQVLCHLSRAEDLSLRYIRKKMQAEAPEAGVICRIKSAALSLALRSPLRFKAPAMSAEVPERETLGEVASRWDAVRREMVDALDEVPESDLSRAVFRHPRVGLISLEQALRFMQDHLDHHRRQLERILAEVA